MRCTTWILLAACIFATAHADNAYCGWRKPSEILTYDMVSYIVTPNLDNDDSNTGDSLEVVFELEPSVYQYRIEKVDHNGRHLLVDFDNTNYNCASNEEDCKSNKYNASVDIFYARSTSPEDYDSDSTLDSHANLLRFTPLITGPEYTVANRTGSSSSTYGQVTSDYADNTGDEIDNDTLFSGDYSMINSENPALRAKFNYLVSVRSRRCGRQFYSDYNYAGSELEKNRGILLRGIFDLKVDINLVIEDGAVIGMTSMGAVFDDASADDTKGLIFIRHADEEIDLGTQTIGMESHVHDISIAGSITLVGADDKRTCGGQSAGGNNEGVSTSGTGTHDASFGFDAQRQEACQVQAVVTAHHFDPNYDSGAFVDGGNETEASNGDETGQTSIDHDPIIDELHTYADQHSLSGAGITTFLSFAQYVMMGQVPNCGSNTLHSDEYYAPTWITSAGGNQLITDGKFACTESPLVQSNWTGGKCARLHAEDTLPPEDGAGTCDDVVYIIARHGQGDLDNVALKDLNRTDRVGCTVNEALFTTLGGGYNATCSHGYEFDNGATCSGETDNCDTHKSSLTFTPFFGLEGDEAYSPLQYSRMWFGRTTDEGRIHGDSDAEDPGTIETEKDAVNAQDGVQNDHSRRLRGVKKMLAAATPEKKEVAERYMQVFHFKVRAPKGAPKHKRQHRHRHH